jgi:hypothetical protein
MQRFGDGKKQASALPAKRQTLAKKKQGSALLAKAEPFRCLHFPSRFRRPGCLMKDRDEFVLSVVQMN